MGFTVRASDDDEKAIDVIKEAFNTSKKGDALLKCAHEYPKLKEQIKTLEKEVYRLQTNERKLDDVKRLFKSLIE